MSFSRGWKSLWMVVVLAGTMSCGGYNYLLPMANQGSDDALYESALKLVDVRDYDGAIAKIASMTSSGQSRKDVTLTRAGAYAGKCGLDFLSFVSGAQGSGAPFLLFMTGFTSATVNVTHCQTAQSIIEGYGTTGAARLGTLGGTLGNNVNTFMAVLGMAKIGAQLSGVADTNPRDGTVDPAFDACAMTQPQIAQVGTGFALILDNFATISATLAGANSNAIAAVSAQCGAVMPNPCSITDPTDPSWANPVVQLAISGLVKSSSLGIQNCNNANPLTCCP